MSTSAHVPRNAAVTLPLRLYDRPVVVFILDGVLHEVFESAAPVPVGRPRYYYVPVVRFAGSRVANAPTRLADGNTTHAKRRRLELEPVVVETVCWLNDARHAESVLHALRFVVDEPLDTGAVCSLPLRSATWHVIDPLPFDNMGITFEPANIADPFQMCLPTRVAGQHAQLVHELSVALLETFTIVLDLAFDVDLVSRLPPPPPAPPSQQQPLEDARTHADASMRISRRQLLHLPAWQHVIRASSQNSNGSVFPGRIAMLAAEWNDELVSRKLADYPNAIGSQQKQWRDGDHSRAQLHEIELCIISCLSKYLRRCVLWRVDATCENTRPDAPRSLEDIYAPGRYPVYAERRAAIDDYIIRIARHPVFEQSGTPEMDDVDLSPAAVRCELNKLFVALPTMRDEDDCQGHDFGNPIAMRFRYLPERASVCPGWRRLWGWDGSEIAPTSAADETLSFSAPTTSAAASVVMTGSELINQLKQRCGINVVITHDRVIVPIRFRIYSSNIKQLAQADTRNSGSRGRCRHDVPHGPMTHAAVRSAVPASAPRQLSHVVPRSHAP